MADEDVYPAYLLDAWKSPRLFYRAVEEDDHDKAFVRKVMIGDPVAVAMGTYRTLSPGNTATGLSFYELTKNNPLRVLICLRPTPVSSTTAAAVTNSSDPRPTPIGFITLFYPRGHEMHHHRDVSLGISLVSGQRGKGYGAEAINWVLDWGFRHGGYHRIGLTAFSYNTRALKLYRSLGFVEEGRIRESMYHNRKRYDEIMFGMLCSEWEKLRGIKDEGANDNDVKVEE
ncbi:Acyl-CoA N-acyltransferase [Naviculisporaceae sp. PSN 640]